MNKIKIIIADDHPIFRAGLKQAVESIETNLVLADASDGEEALFKILSLNPDICILDLDMPKLNGFQVAKKLVEKESLTKVIILTMHKGEDLLEEALKLQVRGFVLKENPLHEVLVAIDKVMEGSTYLSTEVMEPDLSKKLFISNQDNSKEIHIQKLTQSERNILKLIAVQKTSREIADELFISYKTVEKHRSNICDKLQITGNNVLLKFALENKEKI